MKSEFDSIYEKVMKVLNEDGMPAGAMGDAAYVDASVNEPGSPDAIYTLAGGMKKSRLAGPVRRKSMMRRKKKSA
jgi:hypothetical protein